MKQQGFTLMEMLIALTIVGILAGIAYPSYVDSVNKSRRADAHNALIKLQLAQEKLRGNCRFYAAAIDTTAGASNTCAATAANTKVVGVTTSPDGNYTLAISNASTSSYTLTATATGAQAGDSACKKIIFEVTAASPDGSKTAKDANNNTASICW